EGQREITSLSRGVLFTLVQNLSVDSLDLRCCGTLAKSFDLGSIGKLALSELDSPEIDYYQVIVQKVIQQWRRIFQWAHVRSYPELLEKNDLLQYLKRTALNDYFNNHGGKELGYQIVQRIAQSAGVRRRKHWDMLDDYWRTSLDDPWAGVKHQRMLKGLFGMFEGKTSAVLEIFQDPLRFTPDYGETLRKNLFLAIQRLAADILIKQTNTRHRPFQIQLSYGRLMGWLLYKPMIQDILRRTLEPLIFNSSKILHELAQEKEKENQAWIAFYERELAAPENCMTAESIEEEYGLFEMEQIVENLFDRQTRHRKKCSDALHDLQSLTYADCLMWARKHWKVNPDELRKVLARETAYDRKILELLELIKTDDSNELDEDLALDLTSLPLDYFRDYFIERLKIRDEQALALFDDLGGELKSLVPYPPAPRSFGPFEFYWPEQPVVLPCPFLHQRLQIPRSWEMRGALTIAHTLCPGFKPETPVFDAVLQESLQKLEWDKGALEFQRSVENTVTYWQNIFEQTGVSSLPELLFFTRRFEELNQRALIRYFQKDARTMKHKADRAFLKAAGALNNRHADVLANYWQWDDPYALETHGSVKADLDKLFDNAMEIKNELDANPACYSRFGHLLEEKLIATAAALQAMWTKERQESEDVRKKTVLDYKILMGRFIYPSMIQDILRIILEPLIFQIEKDRGKIRYRLDLQELKEVVEKEPPDYRKIMQFLYLTRLDQGKPPKISDLMKARWDPEFRTELLKRIRARDQRAIDLFQKPRFKIPGF
ncbi:MAG TPA: hypothetical protein VMR37_03080, partial [Rhabdochlamydiaceae bacterium]|nr:hypothetical protein [Rhabdochlamydiaceae bacterium]